MKIESVPGEAPKMFGRHFDADDMLCSRVSTIVVVVYHVTNVAIGHGLLKEILAFGTRLRSTHCRKYNYLKLCRPAYFIRTTQLDERRQ